jgi:hypothetical protein
VPERLPGRVVNKAEGEKPKNNRYRELYKFYFDIAPKSYDAMYRP